MVELVIVIVVMGILGAIGAARFFDNSSFAAREYADQVKAIIRYGQKLAVAQNRPIFVNAIGNRFALCSRSTCALAELIAAPGLNNSGSTRTRLFCTVGGVYRSSWMCEGIPSGVFLASSRSAEVGTSGFFYFDAMGRPYNAADVSKISPVNPAGMPSAFTAPLTVTLTSGTASVVLMIEPETGYVH
ncbi:MSHA biogenesis protein MshC [Oxalobacteraceae bacterium]|nr:MSHA biogenesis protein MshC [Oxalobacteraceae bacterium]